MRRQTNVQYIMHICMHIIVSSLCGPTAECVPRSSLSVGSPQQAAQQLEEPDLTLLAAAKLLKKAPSIDYVYKASTTFFVFSLHFWYESLVIDLCCPTSVQHPPDRPLDPGCVYIRHTAHRQTCYMYCTTKVYTPLRFVYVQSYS